MSGRNLPAVVANRQLSTAEIANLQFTEGLPLMLVTLLERRYLSDFQASQWRLSTRAGDLARPLLHEVSGLGWPQGANDSGRVMPHVLTACHDPGQAVIMVLHGQGDRHRLYLGGRRIVGAGGRSTEDFLLTQASAFRAYCPGLTFDPAGPHALDAVEMPDLAALVQSAPALAALTGISAPRHGIPLAMQSLDRLVRAVGSGRYALMVVAEPLDAQAIDATIDACRRLRSEIHSYTARAISQTQGTTTSEGDTHRGDSKTEKMLGVGVPVALAGLSLFLATAMNLAGPGGVGLSMLAGPLSSALGVGGHTQTTTTASSWQESGSTNLLDANAEACERLLERHIERLLQGRSAGWWQTAVYIAAENETVQQSVIGALRSLASGDLTTLDPLRAHYPPAYLLREAMTHGQVLSLHAAAGTARHPLGESYDILGTCLSSEELAVLVNLPQQELPGLPMRTHSDFALSAPAPTADAIELGILLDDLGRELGPVTVTADELNRHCFVTGITGYGKTNTCMQILLEAYTKLRVPFLVLEPAKAEYRRLASVPELRGKLRVYSIGGDSPLPFRLNPLAPVPGIPLGRHIDLLKAVFNASFPMFAGMPYVLEEAILNVYAARGWSLYTSRNPHLADPASPDELSALTPSLEDLYEQIEIVLARKKYGQEIHQNMGAALRSRLQSLMIGNKGLALNTRRSVPFDDLFAGPTVIELRNLGDDEEKAFVMALLFTLLYEYAELRQERAAAGSRPLQHLTLVEEAHRLLQGSHGPASAESGDPRGKAVAMFTDMLAEMRAYGEGFIIADQIPTKLAPETLKNSNLKIAHRLVAPDDRLVTGQCMNLSEPQTRYLNNLPPGLAVVHDERIGQAVLMHIHPAKETRATTRAGATLAALPILDRTDRRYLRRHAGCRACPAPCEFYFHLEEAGNQAASAAALSLFFDQLVLGSAPPAWAAWTGWRADWTAPAPPAETTGVVFCAATQAAHAWLGEYLINRRAAPNKERLLTPADRLVREQAARALGELLLQWATLTALSPAGEDLFVRAQADLRGIIAAAPLREQPACAQCPARCQILAYVAPYLPKIEAVVSGRAVDHLTLETRAQVLHETLRRHLPLLGATTPADALGRHTLYCVLTNTPAPAGGTTDREELLTYLRG